MPGQVLNVGARVESCSFVVSWMEPTGSFASITTGVNSGSEIDQYVVEVRDRIVSNSYISLEQYCTRLNTNRCSIPISVMNQYGFVQNDDV